MFDARRSILLALMVLIAPSAPAWALDFLSVAQVAVMYDAPSTKARPLYIAAVGTPVEAVVTLDAFVKVRDQDGVLTWMEKSALTQQRTVMVRSPRAAVHVAPDEKSATVFSAEKDVVLDWTASGPPGWVQVKHRDGAAGYVKAGDVWGA